MEIVKLGDVNMEYEELDREAVPLLFDALYIKTQVILRRDVPFVATLTKETAKARSFVA